MAQTTEGAYSSHFTTCTLNLMAQSLARRWAARGGTCRCITLRCPEHYRWRHAEAGRRNSIACGASTPLRPSRFALTDGPRAVSPQTSLQALTAGRSIVCPEKDRDRCGRVVAICRASGEDLGAMIVREGLAWAFVRYSNDHVGQEAKANAARLGVHPAARPAADGIAESHRLSDSGVDRSSAYKCFPLGCRTGIRRD